MNGFETSLPLLYLVGAIQLVGLASVAFARLCEGSACQSSGQRVFFACLALVGAVAMFSVFLGPGFWLSSGTTFSLMVLGATCDFSRSRRLASF
jgi:hypothetical protein